MLLLTVVSPQVGALGDRARHLFGPAGGLIGRGAGCDWVLPDERRHLSSRHARISHNGLGFLVTDLSTNGVFLNQRTVPLGRDQSAPLGHGDRLHLADYVVEAVITDQPVVTLPMPEPVLIPLRDTPPFGTGCAPVEGSVQGPASFWDALGVPAAQVSPAMQDRLWRILGAALREAGTLLAVGQGLPTPDDGTGDGAAGQGVARAAEIAEGRAEEAAGQIDRTIRSLVKRDFAGVGASAQAGAARPAP